MSKLHGLQLSLDQRHLRQQWALRFPGSAERRASLMGRHHDEGVAFNPEIRFREDLGVHRSEIIPRLLASLSLSLPRGTGGTSSRSDGIAAHAPPRQRKLHYLEVGVLNGDNVAAVVEHFENASSSPLINITGSVERMVLIDPFENATPEYFKQASPWPIDPKRQQV